MGLYGLCWTAVLHSSCERSLWLRRTRSTIYGPKFLNSILPQLFLKKRRVGERKLFGCQCTFECSAIFGEFWWGGQCKIWAAFVCKAHISSSQSAGGWVNEPTWFSSAQVLQPLSRAEPSSFITSVKSLMHHILHWFDSV